jgi:hypothetical protein
MPLGEGELPRRAVGTEKPCAGEGRLEVEGKYSNARDRVRECDRDDQLLRKARRAGRSWAGMLPSAWRAVSLQQMLLGPICRTSCRTDHPRRSELSSSDTESLIAAFLSSRPPSLGATDRQIPLFRSCRCPEGRNCVLRTSDRRKLPQFAKEHVKLTFRSASKAQIDICLS